MKNFLLALVVFLLWSLIGMWYYSCVIKGLCLYTTFWSSSKKSESIDNEKLKEQERYFQFQKDSIALEEIKAKEAIAEKLRVSNLFSDGEFKALSYPNNDTIFYYQSPVTIYKDRAKIFVPEYNRRYKEDVAKYFALNPNARLVIYGAYDPNNELITSDSLGVARAQFLKERLVRSGLNPDRILTLGVQQNLKFDARDRNYRGISMEFKQLPVLDSEDIEQEEITHKILFSAFDQETFRPDATLRTYADELLAYLNKNPSKTVLVIGHTDNLGDNEYNKWIAQQRAKNVKDYLVSRGIEERKILAISKGESEPMLPNTSEANRSRNRRIEIKVN